MTNVPRLKCVLVTLPLTLAAFVLGLWLGAAMSSPSTAPTMKLLPSKKHSAPRAGMEYFRLPQHSAPSSREAAKGVDI